MKSLNKLFKPNNIFRSVRNGKNIRIRYLESKDTIGIPLYLLGIFIKKSKNGWIKYQTFGECNRKRYKVVTQNEIVANKSIS